MTNRPLLLTCTSRLSGQNDFAQGDLAHLHVHSYPSAGIRSDELLLV